MAIAELKSFLIIPLACFKCFELQTIKYEYGDL